MSPRSKNRQTVARCNRTSTPPTALSCARCRADATLKASALGPPRRPVATGLLAAGQAADRGRGGAWGPRRLDLDLEALGFGRDGSFSA